MGQCHVCGNHYARTFQVRFDGGPSETYVFDSLECAIHRLAPSCAHCGCTVIGHGVTANGDGAVYCCSHCARQGARAGEDEVGDREDEIDLASRDSFPASDPPAHSSAEPGRGRPREPGGSH